MAKLNGPAVPRIDTRGHQRQQIVPMYSPNTAEKSSKRCRHFSREYGGFVIRVVSSISPLVSRFF